MAEVSKSEVTTKFASPRVSRKRRCGLARCMEARLMCVGSEDAAYCNGDSGVVLGPGQGGDGVRPGGGFWDGR